MTRRQAEILLTCVIAVRATSLIFTKYCLREMGTFNLLFMRFLTAFVLLALVFCRRLFRIKRSTLWRGAVLGVLFADRISMLFGARGEHSDLLPYTSQYLKGVFIGAPFFIMMAVLAPIVQLDGGSKCANLASAAVAVVDTPRPLRISN